MRALSDTERKVLEAYREAEREDPDGMFAPYYHTIVTAADGDAHMAYAACKALKKLGLLEAGGRQGALVNAPGYWITDAGKAALED